MATITCAHCGGMFQIQIPTTGHSEEVGNIRLVV